MRYLHDLRVAEEDAVALDRQGQAGSAASVRVAVVRLPHISNFDDFDPLAAEPGVQLTYVTEPPALGGADLVLLPGTKNTRGDLRWLRERGLDVAVLQAREQGAAVIGICGGFQMLGREVCDPLGVEGAPGSEPGLGLLDVTTSFSRDKATNRVEGSVGADTGLLAGLRGTPVSGYEIHMGDTRRLDDGPAPFLLSPDRPDGALSPDGLVLGTYLHGLFANDAFRRRVLANLGRREAPADAWDPEAGIARLAREAERYLDIERIREIAGV
jgi:adenosylcobyric acid synthase